MSEKNVLLVVGSGRSGTSLFAGIFRELGFHVPQPEVKADETNPKGFGEPQWVVNLHTELLGASNVMNSDARPSAFFDTAKVCLQPGPRSRVTAWLGDQLKRSDNVLIKDPRLLWFIPLWADSALALGARTSFVTMLREPVEVVSSKQQWYANMAHPEAGRTAAWVNTMLYTERATRDQPRSFVLYGDLLDDWTKTSSMVCDELGLEAMKTVRAPQMRQASRLVDGSLRRSKGTWETMGVWPPIAELADRLWDSLLELKVGSSPDAETLKGLDALREEYLRLYESLEAVTWSSVAAAGRQAGPRRGARSSRPSLFRRLAFRLPKGVRDLVPVRVRHRLKQAL